MYAVGLPIVLLLMIRFIASSRPMTIPAPEIPKRENTYLLFTIGAAVGFVFSLCLLFGDSLGFLRYMPLLWAVGAGAGVFFLGASFRKKKVRKSVKKLESDFGETLHKLGIILSEGRPLEDAMSRVDADYMAAAAKRIKTMNTDLKSAFFDERFGSLREVHSGMIRGSLDILLSISGKGSKMLSRTAFSMSEHIKNLRKNEEIIERALGGVVSSMRIIAIIVAPLVGGMISSMSVVLAETMVQSQDANVGFASGVNAIDPTMITLIIGVYVMESAVILTSFGSELMHGKDSTMRAYGIGIALPVSVFVFTVCAWVAGSLFGGIA
jgi:hypothetical protein